MRADRRAAEDAERARLKAKEEQEHSQRLAENERALAAERAQAERTLATMRRHDGTIIHYGIVSAISVVGPWLLGRFIWRDHIYRDVLELPWPHPKLPTGSIFLPELMFGVGVIAILVGLLLARPPWLLGRMPRIFLAAVLSTVGLILLTTPTRVATAFVDHARASYRTGPIDPDALGGTCGQYYWTSRPDLGVFNRWLVYPRNQCKIAAMYHGWRQRWRIRSEQNASFASIWMFSPVVVVREDFGDRPDVLLGVNEDTGHIKWRWRCRDNSDLTDEIYHGYDQNYSHSGNRYITVSCSYGVAKINPISGKAM
jgi:hypothetical protein